MWRHTCISYIVASARTVVVSDNILKHWQIIVKFLSTTSLNSQTIMIFLSSYFDSFFQSTQNIPGDITKSSRLLGTNVLIPGNIRKVHSSCLCLGTIHRYMYVQNLGPINFVRNRSTRQFWHKYSLTNLVRSPPVINVHRDTSSMYFIISTVTVNRKYVGLSLKDGILLFYTV